MKPQRIAWGGGLFIAAIVGLSAYDVLRGYRSAVSDTGRELDTQARMIAEQTARSLQAVDVVLRHLQRAGHRRHVQHAAAGLVKPALRQDELQVGVRLGQQGQLARHPARLVRHLGRPDVDAIQFEAHE